MKFLKAKGHNGRVKVWPVHTTSIICRDLPETPEHQILGDNYDFFVPIPINNTVKFPILDIDYKCLLENK